MFFSSSPLIHTAVDTLLSLIHVVWRLCTVLQPTVVRGENEVLVQLQPLRRKWRRYRQHWTDLVQQKNCVAQVSIPFYARYLCGLCGLILCTSRHVCLLGRSNIVRYCSRLGYCCLRGKYPCLPEYCVIREHDIVMPTCDLGIANRDYIWFNKKDSRAQLTTKIFPCR